MDVGYFDAPALAAPDSGFDFGGGIADDDANIGDAGVTDGLDDAEEDWLVGDGD